MGPSKKHREDAWDVRRRYRAELAEQAEKVKKKAEEAERKAAEKQKKEGK